MKPRPNGQNRRSRHTAFHIIQTIIIIVLIVLGDTISGAIAIGGGGSGSTTVNHAVVFFISGNLAIVTTAGNINIYAPFSMTCTEVYAAVNTAPQGAGITIQVLFNGANILVSSGSVSIQPNTLTGSVTLHGNDVTALGKNVDVTINITGVGSTTVGADLVLQLRCQQ